MFPPPAGSIRFRHPDGSPAAGPPALEQRVFLAAGTEEWSKFRETSGAFAEHLAELGVRHEFVVYDGGHGWEDWQPVIEQAMSFAVR